MSADGAPAAAGNGRTVKDGVEYLDGIPVGYFPGRVCYVPDFYGGLFLHDPERRDRLVDSGVLS